MAQGLAGRSQEERPRGRPAFQGRERTYRVWEMRLLAGGFGLDLSPFAFEITGCALEFLPLS